MTEPIRMRDGRGVGYTVITPRNLPMRGMGSMGAAGNEQQTVDSLLQQAQIKRVEAQALRVSRQFPAAAAAEGAADALEASAKQVAASKGLATEGRTAPMPKVGPSRADVEQAAQRQREKSLAAEAFAAGQAAVLKNGAGSTFPSSTFDFMLIGGGVLFAGYLALEFFVPSRPQ